MKNQTFSRKTIDVNEDLRNFKALGNACPECGKKPELERQYSPYKLDECAFVWICKHTEGKWATGILISALVVKYISNDQQGTVLDVIQGKASGFDYKYAKSQLKRYDTESQSLEWEIFALAKFREVPIVGHLNDTNSINHASLWATVAGKMSDEEIRSYLMLHLLGKTSETARKMRCVLEAELGERHQNGKMEVMSHVSV